MEEMNVGSRIKQIRKHNSLSQQAFADKLKVSRVSANLWETGKANCPERSLAQICATFGVSYDWLTTGNGEMFEQSDEQLVNDTMQAYPQFGDLERRILENWLQLPHSKREEILETIQRCFTDDPNADGDS